jgi:hypothetical protein
VGEAQKRCSHRKKDGPMAVINVIMIKKINEFFFRGGEETMKTREDKRRQENGQT